MLRAIIGVLLGLISTLSVSAQEQTVTFGAAAVEGSAAFREDMRNLPMINASSLYYRLPEEGTEARPLNVEGFYPEYPVMVILEFPWIGEGDDECGVLDPILAGEFAQRLNDFAGKIAGSGEQINLLIFPEVNGFWHPHGAYAPCNDAADVRPAWRYVQQLIAGTAADEYIENYVQGFNSGSFTGTEDLRLTDLPLLYAGADFVDVTAAPVYDRCGTNAEIESFYTNRSLSEAFDPIYNALVEFGKPIWISEFAASPLTRFQCTGNWVSFYEEILDSLAAGEYPLLEQVYFFWVYTEEDTATNDVNIPWNAPIESRSGINELRALFGLAPVSEAEAPREEGRVTPVQPSRRSTEATASQPQSTGSEPIGTTAFSPFGFDEMPWSVWARFTVPFVEEKNPAISSVTGDEFGRTGPLLRWNVTQRGLWDEGTFTHGPGLQFGGVYSPNRDQWWNNNVDLNLLYGWYWDAPRDRLIEWGGWSIELYAGRRQYFVDVPERFEDNGEWRVGVNFGVNFGGDWLAQ